MSKYNVEVVETLPNNKFIFKIEQESDIPKDNQTITKTVIKYTITDENGNMEIPDLNGTPSEIQLFDIYRLNELGDIIIGIKKEEEEYYERILSHFDLSDTEMKLVKVPGGPFNIGPYDRQYYDTVYPTKTISDIVPQSYSFNYGLINRTGALVIYPLYDDIQFGKEDTCRVGILSSTNLKFGYNDISTGSPITPVCFDKAHDFSNSRAVVSYRRKFGYIDRYKILLNPNNQTEYAENLAPKFFRASDFEDGEARICITPATHLTPSINARVQQNGEIEVISSGKVLEKKG